MRTRPLLVAGAAVAALASASLFVISFVETPTPSSPPAEPPTVPPDVAAAVAAAKAAAATVASPDAGRRAVPTRPLGSDVPARPRPEPPAVQVPDGGAPTASAPTPGGAPAAAEDPTPGLPPDSLGATRTASAARTVNEHGSVPAVMARLAELKPRLAQCYGLDDEARSGARPLATPSDAANDQPGSPVFMVELNGSGEQYRVVNAPIESRGGRGDDVLSCMQSALLESTIPTPGIEAVEHLVLRFSP